MGVSDALELLVASVGHDVSPFPSIKADGTPLNTKRLVGWSVSSNEE